MSTDLNTGLNTELNPESNVEMTEAQIKEAIIKLNNSEEYLKLNKYYDVTTGEWLGEEGEELRENILLSIENLYLFSSVLFPLKKLVNVPS